ncbi:MAG: protoporphyrinogen oxidase, partial [Nitrospirae bacterium]
MNNIVDVIVVGSGISGLSTAHFLIKKGYKVLIIEKDEHIGGVIKTDRIDGFLVEYGPNSTLDTTPILHLLFKDIGVEDDVVYANPLAKNRYIVRNKRLQPVPTGLLSFLKTPLFSKSAKMRILKEPFIPPSKKEDESLSEFVIRRLGREFLDYAIDPFVAGVYAGLPQELSVKSAFPKLYNLEKKYGSLIKGAILGYWQRRKQKERSKQSAPMLSFRYGMQTLTDAIANRLKDRIKKGVDISSIGYRDGLYELRLRKEDGEYTLTSRALV